MKWPRLIFDKRSVSEAQAKFAFSRRSFVLGSAQLSIGALLATRMAYLSIFENERYTLQAESNRVNLSLIPPRRGWIIDHKGQPLALNRTVFRVDIIPDRVKDVPATLDTLTEVLKLTPDERDRIAREVDKGAGFQPVQVAENLDWERYAAISIRAPDLPGVQPIIPKVQPSGICSVMSARRRRRITRKPKTRFTLPPASRSARKRSSG
jgi:penicillin-binding protein 2